jgi:hypothetical protein
LMTKSIAELFAGESGCALMRDLVVAATNPFVAAGSTG